MKPLALTAALLALACAVTIALAQDDPAPEPAPEPKPAKELSQAEKDALSTRAYFVLRNRCWGCHGEPGKKAYGETVALDWILDYEKLVAAKLVIPGKVKESRLIYLTTLGKMPREFDAEGKPSKEGELPEAEQKVLVDWVKAGAPKWPEMTFTHEWVKLPLPSPLPELDEAQRRSVRCTSSPNDQPLLNWQLGENKWQAAVFVDGTWVERPWRGGADPSPIIVDSKRGHLIGLSARLEEDGTSKGMELWRHADKGWHLEKGSFLERRLRGFGLAYDASEDRVILYGGRQWPVKLEGFTVLEPMRETWQWKDGRWKQLEIKSPPNNVDAVGMVFDRSQQKMVLLTAARRSSVPEARDADLPDSSDRFRTWHLIDDQWVGAKEEPWLQFGRGEYRSTPAVLWDHGLEKPVLTFDDVREGQTRVWTGKGWEPIAQSPFFYPEWTTVLADTKGKRLIALHMPLSNEDGAIETWALIPWRK